jgi:hypothetical protein
MPRRGRGNRGGAKASTASARQLIKREHLTNEPGWFQNKSRRTDPPSYNQSAIYSRKVYSAGSTTATGITYKISDIAAAITAGNFAKIAVTGIKVWGPTGDTGVELTAFSTRDPKESKLVTDWGVAGEARSYISLGLANKDISWNGSGDATNVCTIKGVSTAGTYADAVILVAFTVMYKNMTTAVIKTTELIEPQAHMKPEQEHYSYEHQRRIEDLEEELRAIKLMHRTGQDAPDWDDLAHDDVDCKKKKSFSLVITSEKECGN